MVKKGLRDQKKIKESSRVGWAHLFCQWQKSDSEWLNLFKGSSWTIHWEETCKIWQKIVNICSMIYRCFELEPKVGASKFISCGKNHLSDSCRLFMEKNIKIGFSPSKKELFHLLQWKLFKSLFKFLSCFFDHVGKTAWLEQ